MFRIIHINDPGFTEKMWQDYYNFLAYLRDEKKSMLSSRNADELRERLLAYLNTWPDNSRFVIFADEQPTGWCEIRIMGSENEECSMGISIDVVYDEAPDECAKVVAEEIRKNLKRCNITKANCMATNPRASSLIRKINGRVVNRVVTYHLNRSKANIEAIDLWLEEYPQNFPELRMVFFDGITEEYIEEFSRTFKQFVDEMPSECDNPLPFHFSPERIRKMAEYRRNIGSHHYIQLLLDKNGRIIGHSNGFINEKSPNRMYQAMTGIISEYRGKGLSKWLKAALFKKIGEDFPNNEYCVTEMRAINKPIETVNKQMGYELISSGHEYEISLNELTTLLNSDI